jgi:hypothetical protein
MMERSDSSFTCHWNRCCTADQNLSWRLRVRQIEPAPLPEAGFDTRRPSWNRSTKGREVRSLVSYVNPLLQDTSQGRAGLKTAQIRAHSQARFTICARMNAEPQTNVGISARPSRSHAAGRLARDRTERYPPCANTMHLRYSDAGRCSRRSLSMHSCAAHCARATWIHLKSSNQPEHASCDGLRGARTNVPSNALVTE